MTSQRFHWMAKNILITPLIPGLVLQVIGAQPYPDSPVIKDIVLDWSSHQRHAQGSDNFQLTWADDDHLYGAWGDGGGFRGTNSKGRVGLGIARIEGPADTYKGFNVWGGFKGENPATFDGKSWGMLSIKQSLYMWVVPDRPDGKRYRNQYEYIELALSRDKGATWSKADWRFHQKEHLTFPTFLNFGRDYQGVPEGLGDYVYSYFVSPQSPTMEQQGPNGSGLIVHKPGRIFLARVDRHRLMESRSHYQFYQGLDANGHPVWGSVEDKKPVFEDANGVGWCMSAAYHPGFKRYLLCTEHHASKKGLLGIFDAPTPWGPWTTIKYYPSDAPFGSLRGAHASPWKDNVFFLAFPTKWFEGDSFTLNFTGAGNGKDNDSFNTVQGTFIRADQASLDRYGKQWAPYLEWTFTNETWEGNPYDVQASATFKHTDSGEERTTSMFYGKEAQWHFRFTATKPGTWQFQTTSPDPDLNGRTGTIYAEANPDAYGFVTHDKAKWVRPKGAEGRFEAITPQYVMYAAPSAFHNQPAKIDRDIQTFIVEHGFTGFHVPVLCRWFDLDKERASEINVENPNPDPRTFEALEMLITKVHAAGGVVHLWVWGDEQRSMTPKKWGINGKVDQRLQRYIAARLGPLPGWTMSYGFDLWEWVQEDALTTWHDFMQEKLGWPHLLGARSQKHALSQLSEAMDYSSYEQHRPSLKTYVQSMNKRPHKPSFSEDRFRIRNSPVHAAKDYTEVMTRRGLWHSTMAGGVANIWGNLISTDINAQNREGSYPYPHPHWIQTHATFFRDRFKTDMVFSDTSSDGACLKSPGGDPWIFYKEDTESLRMDLSTMPASSLAVAVDTLKPYNEIDLGLLKPKFQTWTAPYPSDWAIAIGKKLAFTDITHTSKTVGPTASGKTGGHGAMFTDVDRDGLPDLYITMIFDAPMPELFFHNGGDGRFNNQSAQRGIADFDGGSHGTCFADLDNDGDFDLFNGTTWHHPDYPSHNNLFKNDGQGSFQDITATSGISLDRFWPTRGTLCLDWDKDGDLDLFAVTNYQGSNNPPDERNEIYRNEGEFQFTPVNTGPLATAPCGQGVTDTDFDGDGDVDIIAANRTGPVNLLRNDGRGNFELISPDTLGIRHDAKEGISMGDIDNDGDFDMMLAGNDEGFLYENTGNGKFNFKRTFSDTDGYMAGFADLDNDGDLDLVFAGDTQCWVNDGTGNYHEGQRIPVGNINDPRGIAFADIDLDGDLDFAVGCKRSGNLLIRNDSSAGNWLKVRLISPQGQVGAFGAKVRVFKRDGNRLLGMREARSNNGYLGQNDPTLHFGLGQNKTVNIEVTFLDGSKQILNGVSSNKVITIDGRTR